MGVHHVQPTNFSNVCNEFPVIFNGTLGHYTSLSVSLDLDPAVHVIYMKSMHVPFALRPKIDEELDHLVAQGVLEPVAHAVWETPIVIPVKPNRDKPNGSVRICADYKCTLNRALQDHAYPVPVVSHVLATLGGAKIFGKLDLAQAYQQLPVDEATAEAQTIVTHRGAFRVKRLSFGVSVAPGLFQQLMDSLLKGIPGVTPFFDDVLIAAATPADFATRLRTVLGRFQDAGLKVKLDKCRLGVPSVDFLGFTVDREGLHPTREKVKAIVEAPPPKSKAAAFKSVKELLISNSVLAHFDESLPVVLACDASPYGVGAVLAHRLPDGREVPVAYYSRTLSAAERNYAQIDREGLAIVAGVKKFHDFVYGRPFTIATDHRPLLGLFAPDRRTPQVISPRVLRWTIFLAAYDYSIVHRPGKAMGHADARGWPTGVDGPEFAAFKARREELSAHKGCLLWGDRVVVPSALRQGVLRALHEAHPGIVRMKGLARSYVWWPGIDAEVEAWVKRCQTCQAVRPSPPGAPHSSWESTRTPWSRLHIDFAGPFHGLLFLVTVDSYTKWLEISPVSATSTKATIRALRKIFATHGLPDTIVSDNGTAFTSEEFRQFLSGNLIQHIRTAPFHPATNGQAERMVRTAKEALSRLSEGDWECRIARFLLAQRTTPNPVSGRCPAELLMGRRPTILLDRLHPDRAPGQRNPTEQREAPRGFFPEEPVFVLRRHIDQLRRRMLPEHEPSEVPSEAEDPIEAPEQTTPAPEDALRDRPPQAAEAGAPEPELAAAEAPAPPQTSTPEPSAGGDDRYGVGMVGLSLLTLRLPDCWACPSPHSTPRARGWAPLPWTCRPASSLHPDAADDDHCGSAMFGLGL
ncbi:PREDICTED: uncharacterized protein K02A2.6-like [Gekko japonicus]|uniref:Gypsy retrotransposon integrase-like protein 1 n=1 Tax=Gekko japonicus TaxID=146911 RepID=A0ABM1JQ06_GEKJA|nr:PREDICTED: uncharacterized protein K02A2.6-like [Gekko japonicus]